MALPIVRGWKKIWSERGERSISGRRRLRPGQKTLWGSSKAPEKIIRRSPGRAGATL